MKKEGTELEEGSEATETGKSTTNWRVWLFIMWWDQPKEWRCGIGWNKDVLYYLRLQLLYLRQFAFPFKVIMPLLIFGGDFLELPILRWTFDVHLICIRKLILLAYERSEIRILSIYQLLKHLAFNDLNRVFLY